MGLAPYGEPKYVQTIFDKLIDLKDDGSFKMNMDYFNYNTGLTMTNEKFSSLFDGPPRKPETNLTQREMDLARSVQDVTEEIMIRMARHVKSITNEKKLCLAGGVALNCVGNGKILKENIFDNIWIQPAAGDAGGALGAALAIYYQYFNEPAVSKNGRDLQKGSYLGTEYSSNEIKDFLIKYNLPFEEHSENEMIELTSEYLKDEKVIGWFQGRMEFGPRALGARSIIGDARSSEMQKKMNLKIKQRESFRPFAPSVPTCFLLLKLKKRNRKK
jgi:carbamoyltransferase